MMDKCVCVSSDGVSLGVSTDLLGEKMSLLFRN